MIKKFLSVLLAFMLVFAVSCKKEETKASSFVSQISVSSYSEPVSSEEKSSSEKPSSKESSSKINSRKPSSSKASSKKESREEKESKITSETFSSKPIKRERQILEKMTLEEKVAQLFLVRCPEKDAEKIQKKYNFGGYTLYARDFQNENVNSLKNKISSYQSASKVKMFIAVDEEGGKVTRVSKFKAFRNEPFRYPQEIYNESGIDGIISDTNEKARLLKSLNLNLNLAPVCDISQNPSDYIYKRTLGKGAEETAKYISDAVTCALQNNLPCTLKHFPGYGGNLDTHTGISIDKRSIDDFRNNDFLPFKSGIKAGAPIVMVAHNIVYAIDEERPASLSPNAYEILRKELDFSGIIITDDLDMNAIKKYTKGKSPAVAAVLAGCDMLCLSDYESGFSSLLNAVKSGEIPLSRIEESVLRILKCKIKYKII